MSTDAAEAGDSMAEAKAETEEQKQQKFRDKLTLSIGLLIFTPLILAAMFFLLQRIDEIGGHEVTAPWAQAGELQLAASPSEFRVDLAQRRISYRGIPGANAEEELQGLVDQVDAATPAGRTYYAAVDSLMFEASRSNKFATLLLLGLAGVAGVLGVQTRSITNFVGHACFKGDLNFGTWWPYYVTRPLAGFILGIVVVLIVKAGILTVPGDASSSIWWVSLAFLAGFGEEEFRQRLRVVSKALFGEVDAKDLPKTS